MLEAEYGQTFTFNQVNHSYPFIELQPSNMHFTHEIIQHPTCAAINESYQQV